MHPLNPIIPTDPRSRLFVQNDKRLRRERITILLSVARSSTPQLIVAPFSPLKVRAHRFSLKMAAWFFRAVF